MDDDSSSGSTIEGVVGLAGALLDDDELYTMLQRLTLLARHTVSASQAVSITVVQDGRYRTTNSTGGDALAMDEAQYQQDDGPCLEAAQEKRQLEVQLTDGGDAWPVLRAAAAAAGVAGILSTPLIRPPGDVIGALNIYARQACTFGPDDRRTAQLIGEVAAILIGRSLALLDSSRLNDQLRHALTTREIIGEAKGILMQNQRCSRDEAFDMLRRASQRENRKLRDVAEDLVMRIEGRAEGKPPPS